MNKSYQKSEKKASDDVMVPDEVTISLTEIAASAKEGLLAFAVGTGLQVMQAMFAEDVARLCGPKHNGERAGYRHGGENGTVTLGGRRLPVERPRVRSADGSQELPLPSYTCFSSTEVLGRLALERMMGGLSTRRYGVGGEPVGSQVENKQTGTSRSSISRRFIAATESALAALLARPLEALDLVALMIDGVHFAESLCVVALGIDITGVKHPLALAEDVPNPVELRVTAPSRRRSRYSTLRRPPWLGSPVPVPLEAAADADGHSLVGTASPPRACRQRTTGGPSDRFASA